MEFYLVGVVVAFLMGIVKLGVALSIRLSVKARNLHKLGLRYRASTGTFDKEGTTRAGWVGLAIWLVVVAPLGSWVSVASAVWTYLAAKKKATAAAVPNKVKTIQDVVANRELSREQLIEAQEEVKRELHQPGAVLAGSDDEEEPSNLVLENSDGWWNEVTANPANKTLVFYGHTDDYESVFNSTEEYRFDGNEVLTRLLEDDVEHPGEHVWHVKDGVVLESAIRKRAEEKKFTLTSPDEEIAQYKEQVEWHPVLNRKLRFFIMSQHPAEFPLRERRRLIRTELERLEAAAWKLTGEAKAHGLEICEGEHGTEMRFPDSFTDADKKSVRDALLNQEHCAALGISLAELAHIKELRGDLLKLLGESTAA